jgi:transposase
MGVDVGVTHLAVLSTGRTVPNPAGNLGKTRAAGTGYRHG